MKRDSKNGMKECLDSTHSNAGIFSRYNTEIYSFQFHMFDKSFKRNDVVCRFYSHHKKTKQHEMFLLKWKLFPQ